MARSERRPDLFRALIAGVCLSAGLLAGCSDDAGPSGDIYVLRLGDDVVTVFDFNQAFELDKADYPRDPEAEGLVRDARLRLLQQLTEEMLVAARARELGIAVSAEELARAVAAIQADYPEGVFKEMLLEYAVPYNFWEKRLKVRLLMEKVAARELDGKVVITPQDIEAYYRANRPQAEEPEEPPPEGAEGAERIEATQDLNATIVRNIRRQKTEAAYREWIRELGEKFPVEINREAWEHLAGSS